MIKPSELVPRFSALLKEVISAKFDATEMVVTGIDDEIPQAFAALPFDHLIFTGSTRVGRIVAQRAAGHLKPVLLELGGKAPLLVLEDADLDEAVKAAAFGAFMNQGQICMSTERIIVVHAVADAFVAKLAAKAASLAASDPRVGKTPLGAVVDRRAVETVQALIDDALEKGAKRVAGTEGAGVIMSAYVSSQRSSRSSRASPSTTSRPTTARIWR